MVDQLWLCFIEVVDGVPDCVLTCFPDRFGIESQEFDELRSNILASKDRQPIENSKDLIIQTLQACLSTFEPPKQAPFVDFLAMIQETVSKLGSVEDKLQNGFINNLEKLEKLDKDDLEYQEEKARCLEGILDIMLETKTLKEADDMFDEINTIIQVLKQQDRVLRGNVLAQFLGGVRPSKTRSSVIAGEYGGCLLTIQRALDNFEALMKQTNQIRANLKRLCDLQQRTVNVWELRCAREGVQETGRQSYLFPYCDDHPPSSVIHGIIPRDQHRSIPVRQVRPNELAVPATLRLFVGSLFCGQCSIDCVWLDHEHLDTVLLQSLAIDEILGPARPHSLFVTASTCASMSLLIGVLYRFWRYLQYCSDHRQWERGIPGKNAGSSSA